jgi:hypothetical protein
MKVGNNAEAVGASHGVQDTKQAKSRSSFSDVLKEKQDSGPERNSANLTAVSNLLDDPLGPALVAPPLSGNIGTVDSGQAVPTNAEALLASLVREISVQTPAGNLGTVDVQFDSRTLQGLNVRIQKSDGNLNVQFSTSSAAVSQLLTNNVHSLTQALQQRGYVSPAVSIQKTEGSPVVFAGESRPANRDRGGRNGNGQGGQKRR